MRISKACDRNWEKCQKTAPIFKWKGNEKSLTFKSLCFITITMIPNSMIVCKGVWPYLRRREMKTSWHIRRFVFVPIIALIPNFIIVGKGVWSYLRKRTTKQLPFWNLFEMKNPYSYVALSLNQLRWFRVSWHMICVCCNLQTERQTNRLNAKRLSQNKDLSLHQLFEQYLNHTRILKMVIF